jgi:small nuclear ribonucleoprotein (snRNP)-like protein
VAWSYGKLAMNRRVMVNLTSGSAIDGVLWGDRGPLIVLRDANLHSEGGSAPLDGEVIIERDRIAFVQVVS